MIDVKLTVRNICYTVFTSLIVSVSFCNVSKADEDSVVDPVIASVGTENITKLQFETMFRSFAARYGLPTTQAEELVNQALFALIGIKRLYLESLRLNLHKHPQTVSQFENYFSEETTSSRFMEQLEDEVLIEAYIRSHFMIDADHILFAVQDPTDNLQKEAAYDKALIIRGRLATGEQQFAQMAAKHSDDLHTSENGGKLNLFTVFEQVYPIESAAYELEVGVISEPVESRFGYHLIKVNSKTRINGLKQVSHILLKEGDEERHNKNLKEKIWRIHSELHQDNFAELAKKYSEDHASVRRGGSLGTDRLVTELELKKLELPVGSHSEPIRTKIGWHILRVDGLIPFESFWQQRDRLTEQIKLDARLQRAKDAVSTADKYGPPFRVKQRIREMFYALRVLEMITPIPQPEINSDLALLKAIVDSQGELDMEKLEENFPVKINPEVQSSLFN